MKLNDGILCLEIDDRGRITHLEDVQNGSGNIIREPRSLFRAAILRTANPCGIGDNKEDAAFAADQDLLVTQQGSTVTIKTDTLLTAMGKKEISLTLTVTLRQGELYFRGSIKNRSDSSLGELFFPCIGRIDSLGNGSPDLLFPRYCGEKITDICKVLSGMEARHKLHEITETYPGFLSMSWMALSDPDYCLYFASCDPKFHAMSLRAVGSSQGGVTLEMNKFCYVNPGETWIIPEFRARLYRGSWRTGADEYAAWAAGWRHPIPQQEWVRNLNGYFLVINKQQYGMECWPYSTLPELHSYAEAYGCDCLGLFGWYHSGHDNQYPDLEVSPSMGGEDGLRKGIHEVQSRGGHVTLYYQGHLIDPTSPFYQNGGADEQGINIWGTPYYDFYPKYCYSDGLRFFSRKVFVTACPSSRTWQKMMADRIDWIASFGADGAIYDQIGGITPFPCFDPRHGHMDGKPSLSVTQGRLHLLPAIREHVRQHQGFAFLSEHVTDLYSQFLDCAHGIGTSPSKPGSGTVPGRRSGTPGTYMMPELFRYCFPETRITVRNPLPYMDRRLVNYAFFYGFLFELEIRYDTDRSFLTQGEAPQKREYARSIADMRRKHSDFLLRGAFRADEGIRNANLYAAMYQAEDGRRAVALWNDTSEDIVPQIQLEHGTVTGWVSPSAAGDGMISALAPDSVALLFLGE